MSEPRKLRCYQYVNRPYAQVQEVLRKQPLDLLQRATHSASTRASALAASLRAQLAGVELAVDVRPSLHGVREDKSVAGLSPVLTLHIAWEAINTQALFPSMKLELSAWPLSSTETQLEILGEYRPPLGPLGNALDAAVGHRIAEASVHRFLDDVVEQLRRDLPERPAVCGLGS